MLSRERVLEELRAKAHHPATAKELLRILHVARQDRATLRRHLNALVASGDLIKIRGNRFGLADRMDVVVGRLETHPRGYGFVVPDAGRDEPHIYIASPNLKEALHGDRVVARIERHNAPDRVEGRIIRILERANTRVVGRFEIDEAGLGFVVPFDKRLLADVQVPVADSRGASARDMVTVELTRWPTATRPALGRVIEVLGPIDAAGVDTQIIIRKHNIPDVHSGEAVEEARRIGGVGARARPARPHRLPAAADGHDRRRTRPRLRRRDHHRQAGERSLPARRAHRRRLALRRGGQRARHRGLRAEHVGLLPGACRAHVPVGTGDRALLAQPARRPPGAVLRHGGLAHGRGGARRVPRRRHQQRRAHDLHGGERRSLTERDETVIAEYRELVPMFERMRELFEILNGRRRRRGSIDFDLPEPEVLMDEAGLIENIVAAERNVAHRIIEEFMLLANETVAEFIAGQEAPGALPGPRGPGPAQGGAVRGVHRRLRLLAGGAVRGAAPAALPEAGRAHPRHARGAPDRLPHAPDDAEGAVRAGQPGALRPGGARTTRTSPLPSAAIRTWSSTGSCASLRHKKLDDAAREELEEDLPEIARHTSEMERRANDAERELVQWKKVRFMADKVGDEFDGYITGVAAFGLFVELVEHFVEGMVHISSMADDYYRFLENSHALRGETTHKMYRLGDRVRVQVVRVDQDRRQIDLGLVEILDTLREDERRRGPKKTKARAQAGEAALVASRQARTRDAEGGEEAEVGNAER